MLIEKRYSHLDQTGDLVPLAIRIMSFKIRSLRRGTARQRLSDMPVDETPLADPAPDAAQQVETSELQNRILQALEKLGGRCRRLFLLKLEGHRLPEIRELLGADTMQQLYMWDFRCRERMRELTGYSGAK
jgi:RNA polymerase sigma-70 factor (ECF subfamily)